MSAASDAQVAAGRAAGDDDEARVAAVLGDVRLGPRQRPLDVDDVVGPGRPRRQPVVGGDAHPAPLGEVGHQRLGLAFLACPSSRRRRGPGTARAPGRRPAGRRASTRRAGCACRSRRTDVARRPVPLPHLHVGRHQLPAGQRHLRRRAERLVDAAAVVGSQRVDQRRSRTPPPGGPCGARRRDRRPTRRGRRARPCPANLGSRRRGRGAHRRRAGTSRGQRELGRCEPDRRTPGSTLGPKRPAGRSAFGRRGRRGEAGQQETGLGLHRTMVPAASRSVGIPWTVGPISKPTSVLTFAGPAPTRPVRTEERPHAHPRIRRRPHARVAERGARRRRVRGRGHRRPQRHHRPGQGPGEGRRRRPRHAVRQAAAVRRRAAGVPQDGRPRRVRGEAVRRGRRRAPGPGAQGLALVPRRRRRLVRHGPRGPRRRRVPLPQRRGRGRARRGRVARRRAGQAPRGLLGEGPAVARHPRPQPR